MTRSALLTGVLLLTCACGFGGAYPWTDGSNVYVVLLDTPGHAGDGYTVERENGVKKLYVHDQPYELQIKDALLTEWPNGIAGREIRVAHNWLWLPTWDAVEAANLEKWDDAYPAPVWAP